MTDLIVVLDPDYANRVVRAAELAPIWIVASKVNKDACEQLWRSQAHTDHREIGAVTCYETSDPYDRLGSLLGIFPELETHHGEVHSSELTFANGFVLEVIGLAPDDSVTDALRKFGFISFIKTTEGFRACK